MNYTKNATVAVAAKAAADAKVAKAEAIAKAKAMALDLANAALDAAVAAVARAEAAVEKAEADEKKAEAAKAPAEKLKNIRLNARGLETALNKAISRTLLPREAAETAKAEADKANRRLAAAKAEAETAAWAAAKAQRLAALAGNRHCYISEEEVRQKAAAERAVAYIRKTAEAAAARRGAKLPDAEQLERVNAWRKAHGLRRITVAGV